MDRHKVQEYVQRLREVYKKMSTTELRLAHEQWTQQSKVHPATVKLRLQYIEEELRLRGEFNKED